MRQILRFGVIFCLGLVLAGCVAEVAEPPPATSQPRATAVAARPRSSVAPTDEPAGPTEGPIAGPTEARTTRPTTTRAPTRPRSPTPTPPPPTFSIPPDFAEGLPRQELRGFGTHELKLQAEAEAFFAMFYQARSLAPGGAIDVRTLGNMVQGAYADYTLPLVSHDVQEAASGRLRSLRYEVSKVTIDQWLPSEPGSTFGEVLVSVTRTRTVEWSDRAEPPETGTYRFRVLRAGMGGRILAWVLTDFYNPGAGRWVSEVPAEPEAQIEQEIERYFAAFYAARSLAPGGRFDLEKIAALTRLSYRQYTLPLLLRQQDEASAGDLRAVAYSDLSVKVLSYDPVASNHGGLALVEVTRTAHTTRAGGPESPQRATYRFRLHRHFDQDAAPHWVAVDFFQPDAQRWVSEIAGMEVPVPSAGHG